MSCMLTKCLFIVLLVTLCRADIPILEPAGPQIELNEGDPLVIICRASQDIKFIFPIDDVSNGIKTSNYTQQGEAIGEDSFTLTLRREKTVPGDTGYYGCASVDQKVEVNKYDQPDISWVYVFIKSNTVLFAAADSFPTIQVEEDSQLVIPCRPTSPEYTASLFDENNVPLTENVTFDPKMGFIWSNVSIKNSGFYKCTIQKDNDVEELFYFIVINKKATEVAAEDVVDNYA